MILDIAREQVLERGVGLDEAQALEVLQLPDERVDDALALAHEVRMRWCGPEVEVEGIVSHQDRRLPGGLPLLLAVGPLRDAGARGPARHPVAGRGGARDRRHRRDRVLHRRRRPRPRRAADGAGPRGRRRRSREAVEINVACSLGILTREQGDELARRSASTATTTTSRPRARTSATSSPRTRGRSAGRRCSSCASWAWRSAAAASSAWARRSSSAPSWPRSSPRSTPTRCR